MFLSDAKVKNAKPKEGKPLKLTDGGGLYLYVSTTGAKSWRYDYRLLGKRKTYTIGPYPEVSLADARKEHASARALVEKNIDPGQHRKAETQKTIAATKNTFKAVALSFIEKNTEQDNPKKWVESYAKKVRRILDRDVFPYIGEMKVGEVGPAELSPILEAVAKRKKFKMPHQKKVRVRERGATTTALHIKSLCSAIFTYAVSKGLVQLHFDPTWALKDVVIRPDVKHNSHLQLDELPAFWVALENVAAGDRVKLAIELLAHTFVRTQELRLAEKNEFHLDEINPCWLIPAIKMKKRRDHLVPLSPQAVKLVKHLIVLADEEKSSFLFPNRKSKDWAMNPNTINQTLYRMGYAGKFSGHGFRGTASTTLHEKGYPPHVIEMQLAHWSKSKGSHTAASYNHALYLAERAEMMKDWSQMLHADNSNILPFKKKA